METKPSIEHFHGMVSGFPLCLREFGLSFLTRKTEENPDWFTDPHKRAPIGRWLSGRARSPLRPQLKKVQPGSQGLEVTGQGCSLSLSGSAG